MIIGLASGLAYLISVFLVGSEPLGPRGLDQLPGLRELLLKVAQSWELGCWASLKNLGQGERRWSEMELDQNGALSGIPADLVYRVLSGIPADLVSRALSGIPADLVYGRQLLRSWYV